MSNCKSLERFRNIHKGEDVVLICNGPSLNNINFNLIQNKVLIGLNNIFLGFHKFNIYPKYYLAINKKVIENSKTQINQLKCIKFTPTYCRNITKNSPLNYYLKVNPKKDFYHDINEGVQEGFTVTYVALQLAYYMGFKKIIIIGLDHKYVFSGEPNKANFLKGKDINHFSDIYFANQSWDNPDLKNSEKYFRIAKEVFIRDNRQILDCTSKGNCDIFQKSTLEDILK